MTKFKVTCNVCDKEQIVDGGNMTVFHSLAMNYYGASFTCIDINCSAFAHISLTSGRGHTVIQAGAKYHPVHMPAEKITFLDFDYAIGEDEIDWFVDDLGDTDYIGEILEYEIRNN